MNKFPVLYLSVYGTPEWTNGRVNHGNHSVKHEVSNFPIEISAGFMLSHFSLVLTV
jgi:hypothetical protein